MKPNFTLSLSFEGITLLYRAAGGWRVVGEVPLTVPKLKDELAVLRKTAAALDPGGVRCKLLIPNDQIRYLSIDTPGMDEDARRAAAAEALDGATPYPVEALVFDISPDGAVTHVAAVARETLIEAEAFAEEHRFHPVSFVAAPMDEAFLGEPFLARPRRPRVCLIRARRLRPMAWPSWSSDLSRQRRWPVRKNRLSRRRRKTAMPMPSLLNPKRRAGLWRRRPPVLPPRPCRPASRRCPAFQAVALRRLWEAWNDLS